MLVSTNGFCTSSAIQPQCRHKLEWIKTSLNMPTNYPISIRQNTLTVPW